jgi:hypothetical protein
MLTTVWGGKAAAGAISNNSISETDGKIHLNEPTNISMHSSVRELKALVSVFCKERRLGLASAQQTKSLLEMRGPPLQGIFC